MIHPRFTLTALLGLGALLATPSAQAEKKIVAADCDVGGCRCMLSSLTVEDVEVLTGEAAPAGAADMTFVMAFGEMTWVAKSTKEIHRNFGGSGDCPIELFPGADHGPRDGIWEFVSTPMDLARCPLLARSGIPMAMGTPTTGDVPITWNGSFHPDRYMTVPEEYLRWTRIDAGNWRGVMFDDLATQVGGILKIGIDARARLVDSEHVHGWIAYSSQVEESGPLGALMKNSPGMMESMACDTRAEYTGRWKSSR
ncbi:hypothetical protein [Luteimonas sp. A501]